MYSSVPCRRLDPPRFPTKSADVHGTTLIGNVFGTRCTRRDCQGLRDWASSDCLGGGPIFVEENFYNLGLSDHPLQALNKMARNDPNFRDDGRREITGLDSDAFKFRVLTLRQLKDARFFFHNGAFTSVKDVVRYFNAGVPQDAEAASAGTLSSRFTHPRGPGSPRGLGLSDDQVDDLTDFVENGLYDPAFVRHDPNSSTTMFELTPADVLYSVYRPDLAARGAVDGRPASGRPMNNDDALSRRDMGLEFLNVTDLVNIALIDDSRDDATGRGGRERRIFRITNNGSSPVDTHLLAIARGLSFQVEMTNASGRTSTGDPYLRVFLPDGVLAPGRSVDVALEFRRHAQSPPVSFTLTLLSGQGNP